MSVGEAWKQLPFDPNTIDKRRKQCAESGREIGREPSHGPDERGAVLDLVVPGLRPSTWLRAQRTRADLFEAQSDLVHDVVDEIIKIGKRLDDFFEQVLRRLLVGSDKRGEVDIKIRLEALLGRGCKFTSPLKERAEYLVHPFEVGRRRQCTIFEILLGLLSGLLFVVVPAAIALG